MCKKQHTLGHANRGLPLTSSLRRRKGDDVTLIETRRKRAKQVDYGVVLATGFSMLLFVILIWRNEQATLLMLFMISLFYPLAALFLLALTFLSFRAIRSKDLKLTCLNGLSILYIVLWIIALQGYIFSYNFIVVASLIYAVIYIGLGLATLGRIYIENHSG